jgi:rhodanese-related sulfurtransferase
VAPPAIDCDELRRELESGAPIVLVDALPPMSYAHSHLPGAINLTPQDVDATAARHLSDKDAQIVVYCANPECESSTETAQRLIALGYRNVRHYAGGKNEWRERGLPLERAGRPWPG